MNQGSLCLRGGVLYVARHAQTAHVRPYDLDGRPLGPGYSFRGRGGGPIALGGIDVDSDRQVWSVDGLAGEVRAHSLFGRETAAFCGAGADFDDARGVLVGASDVALYETDEALSVLVARSGVRRHALALFTREGALSESLRPLGDPAGQFQGLVRVAQRGPWTWACEAAAGRVQVFRDFEFHFSFRIEPYSGERAEPVAVALLGDGRAVLALGHSRAALVLVDAGGRLQRVLAPRGAGHGEATDVGDVAVEDGPSERETRLAVLDSDAERLAVYNLAGQCHGVFEALPGGG